MDEAKMLIAIGDLVMWKDSVYIVEDCRVNTIAVREAEVAESEAMTFFVNANELKPL